MNLSRRAGSCAARPTSDASSSIKANAAFLTSSLRFWSTLWNLTNGTEGLDHIPVPYSAPVSQGKPHPRLFVRRQVDPCVSRSFHGSRCPQMSCCVLVFWCSLSLTGQILGASFHPHRLIPTDGVHHPAWRSRSALPVWLSSNCLGAIFNDVHVLIERLSQKWHRQKIQQRYLLHLLRRHYQHWLLIARGSKLDSLKAEQARSPKTPFKKTKRTRPLAASEWLVKLSAEMWSLSQSAYWSGIRTAWTEDFLPTQKYVIIFVFFSQHKTHIIIIILVIQWIRCIFFF